MVSARGRRHQARYALQRGVSRRRACALFQVARSTLQYQSRLQARDAALRQHLQAIAQRYPRYGYRRAWALVRADGHVVKRKRVHRVWSSAALQVPQRKRRRQVRGDGFRPPAPTHANQMWAYDFRYDRGATGQQLKLLTVVDEWTRECLAIRVDGRITAKQVIEVLRALMEQHGPPTYIRSDNGPEFIARAVKTWFAQAGGHTAYIDAGKPWQNGTNESFNGTFRDACFNLEWVRHRGEARIVIEHGRRHENEQRPHRSLGYRTPAQGRAAEQIAHILSH